MKQIFDIAAEEFETVGVCLAVNAFGVVKNNLRECAEEDAGLLVVAESGPGAAAAVLLHDLIGLSAVRRTARCSRQPVLADLRPKSDRRRRCLMLIFIVKRLLLDDPVAVRRRASWPSC